MQKTELEPGYIGLSISDLTVNAIIWGADGDFYFFPLDSHEAYLMETWNETYEELEDFFPNATEEDLNMFFVGVPEID